MMQNLKSLFIIFLLVSLYLSCAKDQPTEPTKPKHPFRSEPNKSLSMNDVKVMIEKFDFFDAELNPDSKEGYVNEYEGVTTTTGDQVVIDRASNLMWQYKGSFGYRQLSPLEYPVKYEEVSEYISTINDSAHAGYGDWRLPTLEEAMSLLEPHQSPRVGHASGFGHMSPLFFGLAYIWTADMVNSREAWGINFIRGRRDKSLDSYCGDGFCYVKWVRAVRTIK